MNKKILVMADWFPPAYKAGGPIRSVVNFALGMSCYFDIYVFTSDRDIGDDRVMGGIDTDKWTEYRNGIQVYYASPSKLKLTNILGTIRLVSPDFIYCNSMFTMPFTIFPLLLKRIGLVKPKLVLAPRGMLKPSALAFKARKKSVFLKFLRFLHIDRIVHFHATDDTERTNIEQIFKRANIVVIPNFPYISEGQYIEKISKVPGSLNLIFIGRVHPIKNLHYLIEALSKMKSLVKLTVVGNIEDVNYYQQCKAMLETHPSNIVVEFLGDQPHAEVEKLIMCNHALVLPTQGENFGHAIFESLSLGRPVVISTETPWRNLEEVKAGWDISLNNQEKFVSVMEFLADLDDNQYSVYSLGAQNFIIKYLEVNKTSEKYLQLFPLNEN